MTSARTVWVARVVLAPLALVCVFVGIRAAYGSVPTLVSGCYGSVFLRYFFRWGSRDPDGKPLSGVDINELLAQTWLSGSAATFVVFALWGAAAILGSSAGPVIGAVALVVLYTRVITSPTRRALRRVGRPRFIQVVAAPQSASVAPPGRRTRLRIRGRMRSADSTSLAELLDSDSLGGDGAEFLAAAVQDAVAQMTVEQVCQAWRRSWLTGLGRALAPTQWELLASTRRCYLDELERRDPEGFARWLTSGARAGSDPTKYLNPAKHLSPADQHPEPTSVEEPTRHQDHPD